MDINITEKAHREYNRWRGENLPEDLSAELCAIEGNDDEIYSRFCREIAFGTSGLREKMGAGTSRINQVTIRRASIAISKYLNEKYEKPALVIACDTRNNSEEYAKVAAEEFADNGVDVYLFAEPTPVPVLSFAVRKMRLCGGIMITASHNTREYNGYKVYDHYANQIDDKKAKIIEEYMKSSDPFAHVGTQRKGKIRRVAEDIKESYLRALDEITRKFREKEQVRKALANLKICYSPLNGTGMNYVPRQLANIGMAPENIIIVKSQAAPSGDFETCPAPNPENDAAFEQALLTCEAQEAKPCLILATDPDSDRLGVMALQVGGKPEYVKLSGNQVGEILLDYVCRHKEAGQNFVALKSHVSSPLAGDIAREYAVRMKNVFTGFKNIAFEMQHLVENPKEGRFLFGFEESLGYLYGDYTRDKDAIMAAQLVCLAAAELASEGRSLLDKLEELYERYGYEYTETFGYEYKTEADKEKSGRVMRGLFAGKFKAADIVREYSCREGMLYRADFAGGHRLFVRPSGTEPKLKVYVFARGSSRICAERKSAEIRRLAEAYLEGQENLKCEGGHKHEQSNYSNR